MRSTPANQLSTRPQAVKRRATAAANGKQLGRPCSFTPHHAETVLAQLREGETLNRICQQPGMPSIGLVLAWSDGDYTAPIAQFPERFARALSHGWQAMGHRVLDESTCEPGADMATVAARKLYVDSLKWLLARRLPETYGDRLQVTGNASAGAVVNVYLPSKGAAGDGARVTIDGQAVDVTEES